MNRYDVVVVGGRVAGASTAMLLARRGAKVALVERSERGSDTLSTHALMRGGVLQLARWGVLDRITSSGTPPVRRTVFHYADAEPMAIDIASRHGVDALYAPRRTLLDRVLVEAAAEAGVHVHQPARVTGLVRSDEGVCGVRVLLPGGASRVLTSELTVGADGVRSMVATQVGARVRRRWDQRSSTLYRYLTDLPTDGYEWGYGAGAAAGLIPTDGGATCMFVSTTRSTLRSLRPRGVGGALRDLLERAAPAMLDRVARATPIHGTVRGFSGHHGYMRDSAGPGWALVGDAAYFKDPITAHGITDALRDAELRDGLSHDLADVTDRVAAYDWDTPRLQQLLKEVAVSMKAEVDHLASRGDAAA